MEHIHWMLFSSLDPNVRFIGLIADQIQQMLSTFHVRYSQTLSTCFIIKQQNRWTMRYIWLLIYRKKKVIKKHMLQVIFICNFFLLFFPFLFHFLSRCSSLVLHAHFPSLHLRALTKKNSRIIITSRTHHSRICVFNVFSMICIVDGNIFFFFVIMWTNWFVAYGHISYAGANMKNKHEQKLCQNP